MRIVINPPDNIFYESYYVYGLVSLFGRKVVFSAKPFVSLGDIPTRKGVFCFVVNDENGKEKHYAISYNDSYEIVAEIYNWCDVYGSVNANFAKTSEKFHDKLVPLCPSFGIRVWNGPQTVFHVLHNVFSSELPTRKFLGKFKRQLQRLPYSEYLSPINAKRDDGYVFFLSTLWYSDEWNRNDEGVNARRANFIHACKELDEVVFDGGLVSQGKDRSSEDLFADCLCGSVTLKVWMERTKRSALVFNTPAFWDCHGWKLGEYLAMGKCIVSTKLLNDLPAPLEHGKNIHFVENDKNAMKEAIQYIVAHPDYRMKLERGAKAYWEQYGSPIATLKLLGIER